VQVLAMVAAGLGVSCTPNVVCSLRFPGVITVPLSPVIQGGFSAVWDPRTLSPVAENFLTVLRAERALHE
jgi:DNA-binding transcriptional LysR family regulator